MNIKQFAKFFLITAVIGSTAIFGYSYLKSPDVTTEPVGKADSTLSLVGETLISKKEKVAVQRSVENVGPNVGSNVAFKANQQTLSNPVQDMNAGVDIAISKNIRFEKPQKRHFVSDNIVLQIKRGSDLSKLLSGSNEIVSQWFSKIAKTSVNLVRVSGDIAVLKIDYQHSVNNNLPDQELEKDRKHQYERIANVLKSLPGVVMFEEDVVLHPSFAVNDPRYAEQWFLDQNLFGGSNASSAWNKTIGKPLVGDIVVGVIDTGKTRHSDLDANMLSGYDFIWESSRSGRGANGWVSDASDLGDRLTAQEIGSVNSSFVGCDARPNSSWHGTHVSGILAAVGNNNNGVIGVAPGVKILPVRVLGKCGGYMTDIASGIRWAAGLEVTGATLNPTPAKIINLSLGGIGSCPTFLQSAISDAIKAGTVVVVAAGNENTDSKNFTPANCTGVISVGSVGQSGDKAYYSDFGSRVNISAPGGDARDSKTILSTLNSGSVSPGAESYAFYQGTSMAAPVVSGGIALVMAANPRLSSASAYSLISRTVKPFPTNSTCAISHNCGIGIVDVGAAVGNADAFVPDIVVSKFLPLTPVIAPNIGFNASVTLVNIGTLGTDVSQKGKVEVYLASALDGSTPLKIGEAVIDNMGGIGIKASKVIKVTGLKIGDQAIVKDLLPGSYGIFAKFVSDGWENNSNNSSKRLIIDYVLPQLSITKKQPVNMAPADIAFVASFNDPRLVRLAFGSDWVYDWNFSSGTVLKAAMGNSSIRITAPGDGVATLTLKHVPSGFQQTATSNYSISAAPPTVVSFTEKFSNEFFRAPVTMSFNPAITAGHPLDRVASISWDIDNGEKTLKTFKAFSVFEAGNHVVRATVKTKMGFTSAYEKAFTVAENQVPVCSIDHSIQPDKRTIKFMGNCRDFDGVIKNVSWTVNGQHVVTSAANPYAISYLTTGNGTLNVVIRATDDSKGYGEAQITVAY